MFARFLLQLRDAHGEAAAGLSVLTLTELAHGIERAKVEAHCKHRQAFLDDLIADIRIIGTEIRVRVEDGLLAARFGEQFRAWQNSVPAYIPLVR